MKAYNSRKTPREIYLFRKKCKEISLTKMTVFTNFLDGTITRKNTHRTFKVIRKNKVVFLRSRKFAKAMFSKQLSKILLGRTKETSISSMIACFKGIADNGKCTIDFSKVKRKDFVSRDIMKITKILTEKGILKENKGS